MTYLPSLSAIAVATLATAAAADTMPLTYDVFEVSVPHVDLETCPASMAAENTFCRATLASDAVHVFAFSEDGDSPMVGFASFETEALAGALE